MKAWQITSLANLPQLTEVPDPVPQPGEALVRVMAAGLNFADLLMARGTYQHRPALPFIPGLELAGVVESLGLDTDGPPPGSRVLAVCANGAFAERAVVSTARLSLIPSAMTMTEAAAFPIAYGTSHLALTRKARLAAGETLFVTGAAGGVGLTAVEVGKRLGARVIASARGTDRLAVAGAAGADILIDSDAPGLKDALRAAGGVDVVCDVVGGSAFDEALRACNPGARMLAIGFASGQVPQIPANILLVRNVTVSGFWYGGYQGMAPGIVSDSMTELLGWYTDGGLTPHLSHVLAFDQLPEGLDLLRERRATGKVVIAVDHAAPSRSD